MQVSEEETLDQSGNEEQAAQEREAFAQMIGNGLQRWVCCQFGVEDLNQVDPLSRVTPMHTLSRSIVVPVQKTVPPQPMSLAQFAEMQNCGQLLFRMPPPDHLVPCHRCAACKTQGTEACTSRVSYLQPRGATEQYDPCCVNVFGVKLTDVDNPWELHLGARTTENFATNNQVKAMEQLQEDLGTAPRTAVHIQPHSTQARVGKGVWDGHFLDPSTAGPGSRTFLEQLGALRPGNIMNGVLRVPEDDCVRIGLPVRRTHPNASSDAWCLIPHMHLLQWPFDAEAYVLEYFDLEYFSLRVRDAAAGATRVLYYVTPEACCLHVRDMILKSLQPALQICDLSQFGLEVYPFHGGCGQWIPADADPRDAEAQKRGQMRVDFRVAFVTWPKEPPALPPAPIWKRPYYSFSELIARENPLFLKKAAAQFGMALQETGLAEHGE